MRRALLSFCAFLAIGAGLPAAHAAAPPPDTTEEPADSRSLFDREMDAAQSLIFGDPRGAMQAALRAQAAVGTDPDQRAAALRLEAEALIRLGRRQDAADRVAQAGRLLTDETSRLAADLSLTTGRAATLLGDAAGALLAYQRAHDLYVAFGDGRGQAAALNGIALTYLGARRYDLALDHFERSVEAVGDDPQFAYSANHYKAEILRRQGRVEAAAAIVEENLGLADTLGVPMLAASAHAVLAELLIEAGDLAAARDHLAAAAGFADDPNAQVWSLQVAHVRARLALAEGDAAQAEALIATIFDGYDFAAPQMRYADLHRTAYRIFKARGDEAAALRHFEKVTELDLEKQEEAHQNGFALLSAQFEDSRKDLEIEILRNASLEASILAAARQRRLQQVVAATLFAGAAAVLLLLVWHLRGARRASEALAAKNAELQTAMAAKNEFLARTSHEIRTPLNAVLGLSEAMLRGGAAARSDAALRTVHEAGVHLLSIVEDILDLARMERREYRTEIGAVDIEACLARTLALHRANAEAKGLSLALDIEAALPLFLTDDRLVQQAVGNLVSNALKFTQTGEVRVTLAARSPEPGFVVTVRDTGIGIPEDQIEAVFDSFHQVDGTTTRQHGGTGLGLAIVRNIAELLGGTVRVESEPGRGSAFTLDIPAQAAAAEDRGPADAAAPVPGLAGAAAPAGTAEPDALHPDRRGTAERGVDLGRMRLLIAEDNKVNQLVLTALLAKEAGRIDIVENGAEALQRVQEERYDLVLMDNHMPVMSGLEATREIRAMEEGGDIPIIAVTADVTTDMVEQLHAAGTDAIVPKPVARAQLLQAMARLLGDEPSRIRA